MARFLTALAVAFFGIHSVAALPQSNTCETGLSMCDGECVDLTWHPYNCGACGKSCGNFGDCVDGKCQCPPGFHLCFEDSGYPECLHFNDPYNCGGCNKMCLGMNQECFNEKCITCPEDQISCSGNCVNARNDNQNCGYCGNVCGAGMNCVNGQCEGNAGCPPGQGKCGTDCINMQNDNRHCGACDAKCAPGKNCVSGQCK